MSGRTESRGRRVKEWKEKEINSINTIPATGNWIYLGYGKIPYNVHLSALYSGPFFPIPCCTTGYREKTVYQEIKNQKDTKGQKGHRHNFKTGMKFSGGRRRVFTIKAGRETGDMQRFETGQMATDGAVAYVDSLAEFVKLRQRELLGEPVENTTEIIGAS